MFQGNRVCVIGMITDDVLVAVGGHGDLVQVHRQLGGILHSAVALASNGIPVAPISLVDSESKTKLLAQYESLPLLDMSHLQTTSFGIPTCNLFWAPDVSEPTELTQTHGLAISANQIIASLRSPDLDFLYVNLPVGHDIELRSLRRLRRAGYRIYLDFHMLAYSRDDLGNRYLRAPRNALAWLAEADAVQMNATELHAILRAARIATDSCADGLRGIWTSVLRDEELPRAIIVTGADTVVLSERFGSRIRNHCIQVDKVSPVTPIDTVGCGDVFGAGVVSQCRDGWSVDKLVEGIRVGMQWSRKQLFDEEVRSA